MAFESLRRFISGGASKGTAPGDAVNSFEIDFSIGKALSAQKRLAAAIDQLTNKERKLANVLKRRKAAGALPLGGRTTLLGRLSAKFRNNAALSVGAEGIRVGDVRLSRSGIGLSEKTLVGSGPLAFGVVSGQIAGTILQGIVRVRDKLREGATYEEFINDFVNDVPGRLVGQVADLFGLQSIAKGTLALITGLDFKTTEKMWRQTVAEVWDFSGTGINRLKNQFENDLEGLKVGYDSVRNAMQRDKKMKTVFRQKYPQTITAQADALREDIASDISEARLLIRDFGGRPIWKTLAVSLNGGQQ